MPCFIFFIYLFIFNFSKTELCNARYLSYSDLLYHSTAKEQETATVHNELMPDSKRTASDVIIFQHTLHASNGAVSLTMAPQPQHDQHLKETEKDDNAAMNKSFSNVSPSAEEIHPSFDYSDYSRPRTRPPSHN